MAKRKQSLEAKEPAAASVQRERGEEEASAANKGVMKRKLLPSLIKNKEKRIAVHAKLKKEKKVEKRKQAKARDAARKRALELGEEPPPKSIPKTIENTRELDETVCKPDDEEVLALLNAQAMETTLEQNIQVKDEEEYVLLDLDDVCAQLDIPPNAPYRLLGLDTLNPVLVIGDRLKLIGEYQETMGRCYIFSETDRETEVLHPETGPSERNLFKEKCIVDSNSAPSKQVQPITSLHKVLKFRLATEEEIKNIQITLVFSPPSFNFLG